MGTAISWLSTSYTIPALGEDNWGTDVTNYLISLSTGALSKSGGAFTLTAETDFGANFGLKSIYYKSRGTVSSAGILRLANNESVGWRNQGNSANLELKVDTSNDLVFDSNRILDTTDIIDEDNMASDSATLVPSQQSVKAYVDASISANDEADEISYDNSTSGLAATNVQAAIDEVEARVEQNESDIAQNASDITGKQDAITGAASTITSSDLTADRALVSNGSGKVAVATTTATEIGYVNGVTSAIQTQLDAKFASADVIDEDNMASDSNTKVPTQQSVKAYVDTSVAAAASIESLDAAAGTAGVTLTTSDESDHVFTPSSAITVKLDNSYSAGRRICIFNNGTAEITLTANDDSTIATIYRKTVYECLCVSATPTTTTNWLGITPIMSPEIDRSSDFSIGAAFGSATAKFITIRRIGHEAIVRGYFTNGTVTGGTTAYVQLPSGMTIDTSAFSATAKANRVGRWETLTNSGTAAAFSSTNNEAVMYFDSSDTDAVYFTHASQSNIMFSAAGTSITATSFSMAFEFRVPISGWSTNKG